MCRVFIEVVGNNVRSDLVFEYYEVAELEVGKCIGISPT